MLQLHIDDRASPALAALPARLHAALAAKAAALAAALQEKIQGKLAGGVLNSKSGVLADAISLAMTDTGAGFAVTLAVSSGIQYAAIQEYGGTIPPHEILPDKAKALAFVIGGKRVFAARVNLPAITLPERSYMRASLAEMAGAIRDGLGEAVSKTLS